MNSAGRAAIVVLSFVLAASCVPPARKAFRDETFLKPDPARKAWRKVAVLPFAGDPAFRRVAAEWLAFRVRRHGLFEIVDPSFAEIELGKKGVRVGDAEITPGDATRAGRLLGADGVISGSVALSPSARWGPRMAGATVVDVATGKVVADSRRGYFASTWEHRAGAAAVVDGIASDVIPVLYGAAGKSWTPPPDDAARVTEPDARQGEPR